MATQKKKTQDTKVTRISASDKSDSKPVKSESTSSNKSKSGTKTTAKSSKPTAKTKGKPVKSKASVVEAASDKPAKKPSIIKQILGYFKGAWYELMQVRWPNRRNTWGLTLAVIIFSAFFVLLVMGLDLVFGKLFNLLIG